jgi:hypothetical protein
MGRHFDEEPGKEALFTMVSCREELAGYQLVGSGNGLPRRRRLRGLRGRPRTLELRHGPDSYGRQQWGILGNGRKADPATPRVG